jgi:hypothetical protein
MPALAALRLAIFASAIGALVVYIIPARHLTFLEALEPKAILILFTVLLVFFILILIYSLFYFPVPARLYLFGSRVFFGLAAVTVLSIVAKGFFSELRLNGWGMDMFIKGKDPDVISLLTVVACAGFCVFNQRRYEKLRHNLPPGLT